MIVTNLIHKKLQLVGLLVDMVYCSHIYIHICMTSHKHQIFVYFLTPNAHMDCLL